MSEIVGACLSQFHDDENSFELLLAYSDGREVGFSVSRKVAQKMASELANGAGCDPSAIERKGEPLEHVEKVSTEAAMSQWERSLKRPDLCEKDRVRGAVEAYKRQAFAFAISPTPPAAPVRETPAPALDWSNFEGPKRNVEWKPDDQDLIYTATNYRDDEYGDADEDVGQQLVERLLAAWRSSVISEQLTFEISARLLKERDEAHAALSASPSPVDSRDGLIERLVKALKPFAQAASVLRTVERTTGREFKDEDAFQSGLAWNNDGIVTTITYGHLRAARAALAAKEQQP